MTAPKEASVVRFHELGGPDVLRIERTLVPPPGPGYVRINVRAIGLNRADAMFRRGTYIEKAVLPSRLGYEASGVVDAVGSEVHGLLQGDEVSVMPCPSLARHGTYSDTILMPATHVVPKPDHLSFEEAASLWMQSLTAFGGLIHAGGLQSGQTVLITAASSSVGIAAIQIARAVGALPIATTLTGDKKAAVLEQGAAHVVATAEEDLGQALDGILDTRRLDVVFDAVGGPQVQILADRMAPEGTIVSHGMLDDRPTEFPLRVAIRNGLTMRGYVFTQIVSHPRRLGVARRFVSDAISSGMLRAEIDRVFPFDAVVDAHRYLESNQQIGKIVLRVD